MNRQRNGVTIVEVLTSIIVATIGVAGVLVLIPFGIRQAQVGLDLDDSTTMVDNAFARFQIDGFAQISEGVDLDNVLIEENDLPWYVVGTIPQMVANDPVGNRRGNREIYRGQLVNVLNNQEVYQHNDGMFFETMDRPFVIDPLWMNALTNPGDVLPDGRIFDNLFVDQVTLNADPNFQRALPFLYVNLVDLTNPVDEVNVLPNPLPQALAARLFLASDNVQFASQTDPVTGLDLDDLDPPRPFFDVDASRVVDGIDNDLDGRADEPDEARLKRQVDISEASWSAIAVPRGPFGTDSERIERFDFYILVYKNRSFANPIDYVAGNPGLVADRDPRLFASAIDRANTPLGPFRSGSFVALPAANAVNVRNDDWVMMVNVNDSPDINTVGFRHQVGFYRVIGSDPNRNTITLDGPPFVFEEPTNDRLTTYIVYLKDVVNVYQRSLRIESSSNAN